jgi:hypothetical protein
MKAVSLYEKLAREPCQVEPCRLTGCLRLRHDILQQWPYCKPQIEFKSEDDEEGSVWIRAHSDRTIAVPLYYGFVSMSAWSLAETSTSSTRNSIMDTRKFILGSRRTMWVLEKPYGVLERGEH